MLASAKSEAHMNKTVLITGTSSGYGKATAQLFLDRGWNVLAAMRRPNPGIFASADERLKLVELDVTDQSSIDSALAEGVAHFGTIDVLVNNAGIGLASVLEATPDKVIREVFETNTFGTFATCRSIIPLMRREGKGVIVNVTSSAAIGPMPLVSVYTGSKCAVEGFTESLAYELRPFGITARLVEPGYALTTNFTANGGARMSGLFPDEYATFTQAYFGLMANYPTAYCTEAEVAEAALAAATDEGRRMRYPAGPDSHMLAELRWSTSEDIYREEMRRLFDPAAS